MKTGGFVKMTLVMIVLLMAIGIQMVPNLMSLTGENKNPGTSEAKVSRAETKPLDDTVKILSKNRCWKYEPDSISIKGKKFSSYGFMPTRCGSKASVTFDVEGWDRFTGYVGIVNNDERSNTLTVEVDGRPIKEVQVKYDRVAELLDIPLKGHQTLTFKKGGRYPLIYFGEPVLHRR
ncbi:MAG: hypothetical protein L0229_20170 [Blastocatellia bacterium]|nr:hypothetical protein [Blastocatellia bacterium]